MKNSQTCYQVDFGKVNKNIDKYLDRTKKLKKLWGVKVVVGALGKILRKSEETGDQKYN